MVAEDYPEGQEKNWVFVMCSPRFVLELVKFSEQSGEEVGLVRLGRSERIVGLHFYKRG